MEKVLDFLKSLYSRKANDPDPIVRAFMNICRSVHDDSELMEARGSFKDRFGLPEKEFDDLYASYAMALSTNGKTLNWNDDIESMLRKEGLTDGVIEEARHDLRTAVLQRIFLRLSTDEKLRRVSSAATEDAAGPGAQGASADPEEQAPRRRPDPREMLERAATLSGEGRHSEAKALLEPFAQAGDAVAQYRLGMMFLFGHGTPPDFIQAAGWLRRSAEQGYAPAQYGIAVMHRRGEGGPRDDAAAVAWYRKAAVQDYPPALYNLGAMYLAGHGVPRDEGEGMRLTLRAAEMGNPDAAYKAAISCLTGTNPNLPRSSEGFHRWIEQAAVEGHPKAQTLYAAVRYHLDADDTQADAWISRALAQGEPVAGLVAQEIATSRARLGDSKVCRYVFAYILDAAGLRWDRGGTGLAGQEASMSADDVDRARRIVELIDECGNLLGPREG